ncbi:MAG: 3-phosphoserine/phosphohydroxythreonine transaminase [Bdellovibrionota bacterium]|jgi:phosphoserine aminotransferase
MKDRAYNFNPGPAVLPLEALDEVVNNVINYKESGIGLFEMSHRGKDFEQVLDETTASFKELLDLRDDYEVLYTTGGATNQFSMVPINLLPSDQTANYILSGVWAKKAAEEARKFGKVHVAATSADDNFKTIPQQLNLTEDAAYCHFTSNNTIYGTQYKSEPAVGDIPLICDASSDFLHKPLDIRKYALIYAGAQKNLGPAGVTIVIIRKDLLERARVTAPETTPIMLNYQTYADSKSLYNTPPVFAIYVVHEVLKWIKNSGGLEKIAANNQAKAKLIYDVIDSGSFYSGHADPAYRSVMNITFRLPTEDLEKKFVQESSAAGLIGLKGHRSVGGLRASIYNAFPTSGAETLANFMKDFEAKNG